MANFAFLDDEVVGLVHCGIHAVHYLLDLPNVQVFQEVIIQDGVSDQILSSNQQTQH